MKIRTHLVVCDDGLDLSEAVDDGAPDDVALVVAQPLRDEVECDRGRGVPRLHRRHQVVQKVQPVELGHLPEKDMWSHVALIAECPK